MKINIKITKEILERSMMCGLGFRNEPTQNCAIAIAVRDLFPEAAVHSNKMFFLKNYDHYDNMFYFSDNIIKYIEKFDGLIINPYKRPELPEISFEIEVPISIIEKIGISEATKILSKSKSLELLSID